MGFEMKKYRKPGKCEYCFFGWDLSYFEEATCNYHEGRPIKRGQLKCNQFLRRQKFKK